MLKIIITDNRGLTLIEVIVSLLIIMVIFTPLMMSFVQAAKINNMTSETVHADDAASNLMETVKGLGLKQFINYCDSTRSRYSLENRDDLYADETTLKETIMEAGCDVRISGVRVGTKEFDAVITFSKSNAGDGTVDELGNENKINDYQFANFSAFADDNAIIVFPRTGDTYAPSDTDGTELITGFDDRAVHYFSVLNNQKAESEYAVAVSETESLNYEIIEANANLPAGTPPTPTLAVPARSGIADAATIRKSIKRNIVIEIKRNATNKATTGQIAGVGFEINSYVVYEAQNSPDDDHSTLLYDSEAEWNATQEIAYEGYCTNVYQRTPESLFLIYMPPKGDSETEWRDSVVTIDCSDIPDDMRRSMKVFVVHQKTENNGYYLVSPTINLDYDEHGTISFVFKSNAALHISNTGAEIAAEPLIDKEDAVNRLFDVTVEVYEKADASAGIAAFTNKVAVLSSTFLNGE